MSETKSNSVISTKVEDEGLTLVFEVKGAGVLKLDRTRLSAKVRERAELHGLIQRVSDRAAISRNKDNGFKVTPEAKLEAMKVLVDHLNSGTEEWELKREGGGGPSVETTLLVKALGEIYPQRTEEQLREWLRKRSASDRAALLASEKIKPIVERLRAQSAQGIDADELLSELSEQNEESASA